MIVTFVSATILVGIILSSLPKRADPLSPGRIFGATWAIAVGLTSLKLSALQRHWSLESWLLLLLGISAFVLGNFTGLVLNLHRRLYPIDAMRSFLGSSSINERRLFTLLLVGMFVYFISYIVIYLVKGFLPIQVVGTRISRTEFYVFGFGVFINSTAFISSFSLLYILFVEEKTPKKVALAILGILALGSYFLLLQRFQIIMAAVIVFTFLYYATKHIRAATLLPLILVVIGFFYWISSLRLQELFSVYMYAISKMRLGREFAFLAEPYMYVVMNLENFARTVDKLDHHTYGYFTFDFITALTGLKYWIVDYFSLERLPYLISGYNTYSAFWYFYRDFGVLGLGLIPLLLGLGISLLYYEMRANPTLGKVMAYGIMVFVMIISFFHFPIAFLWFEYNILMFFLFLKYSVHKPQARVVVR